MAAFLNSSLAHASGCHDRRDFLRGAAGGLGLAALGSLFTDDLPAAEKHKFGTHFEPKAKRVIWLFMHGGPSHVDLFDPKPDLVKYAGQPLPESFGMVMTRRDVAKNPLLGPIKPFAKRGECGLEVSDFLPHIAEHADELCVIRSMHGDSVNHPQSVYQMNTGSILMGRPSVGSWVAYGLGSENKDLPAFVVLPDPAGGIKGGPPAWGSGFLPATYQGITMRPGASPILDLAPQREISKAQQRSTLDLVQQLNREQLATSGADDELDARINAYELAFRMQSAAPELVDLAEESKETQSLYGLDEKETQEFGRRCLLARRMIERGVRFVQLYSGNTEGWDAHTSVLDNHTKYCRATDKPVAGLLTDLKRRGLLDDTLVIWGGEFGRMPMSEQGKGRDHNPWGYTVWLAGAGVKPGHVHGATDAIGLRAEKDKVHIHNFHATLLNILGIDHHKLSYFHNGLGERLVGPEDVEVVREILS
jgi:hypothetical protein